MKLKLLSSYEYSHIHNVIGFTLNFFGSAFTDYRLKKAIEAHVNIPSISAVKDILAEYGIQSTVIRKGNYSYNDFETPFICLIKKENWVNKNFAVVTKVEDSKIEFLDAEKNRLESLSEEDFEKIDDKIVLLMDGTEKRNEDEYNINKNKQLKENIFSVLPFLVILMFIFYNILFREKGLSHQLCKLKIWSSVV